MGDHSYGADLGSHDKCIICNDLVRNPIIKKKVTTVLRRQTVTFREALHKIIIIIASHDNEMNEIYNDKLS